MDEFYASFALHPLDFPMKLTIGGCACHVNAAAAAAAAVMFTQ